MIGFLARLLVLLAPIGAFTLWVTGPVQQQLYHHSVTLGIVMLLGGLAVLAALEGALLKFWLLPLMARRISEQLYAGSYLPENDPLAMLAQKITEEHRPELIPELEHIVHADPRRTRAWLVLSQLIEAELHDAPRAVEVLLQGAAALKRNREDAALLIWRAATLCHKHASLEAKAATLHRQLAEQYPHTQYGRLAAQRVGSE